MSFDLIQLPYCINKTPLNIKQVRINLHFLNWKEHRHVLPTN